MKGIKVAAWLVASVATLLSFFAEGCGTYIDHCKTCDWSTEFCFETVEELPESVRTELTCRPLPQDCQGRGPCDCLIYNFGNPGDMCTYDEEGKGSITLVTAPNSR
jgi:hypothetical protein